MPGEPPGPQVLVCPSAVSLLSGVSCYLPGFCLFLSHLIFPAPSVRYLSFPGTPDVLLLQVMVITDVARITSLPPRGLPASSFQFYSQSLCCSLPQLLRHRDFAGKEIVRELTSLNGYLPTRSTQKGTSHHVKVGRSSQHGPWARPDGVQIKVPLSTLALGPGPRTQGSTKPGTATWSMNVLALSSLEPW